MEKINLKCRAWHKGVFPSVIKLDIPGWAGANTGHDNGCQAQPWHCPPFVEASTYGLEVIYPFETDFCVKNVNGEIKFEGDFSRESKECGINTLPFVQFSSGHFGMQSGLDIKVPESHVLRTEPHPAFYTDTTGSFPCCVPGHIQTNWWPKFFFIVFKSPPIGGSLIFKKGQAVAQILIIPKKISYSIEKMSNEDSNERNMMNFLIENNIGKIAKNCWADEKGNHFSDKYKQLSSLFCREGYEGVKHFLYSFLRADKNESKNNSRKCPIFRIKK